MAKGWESKAVEQQIEAASEAAPVEAADKPLKETIEQKHRRDGLQLTRSHLAAQLKNARFVTQRQVLHQSLQAIDEELAKLSA